MDQNTNNGLAALFLEHAKGYMTPRALEERRTRIIKYISRNKYTIKDETLEELTRELSDISKALGES